MLWKIDFYEDKKGQYPVEDSLDSIPDRHLGKVLQVMQMLEEFGPNLPFPYSSQVEGKLREFRAHYGRVQYRILYYGDLKGVFILLHAFRKQTPQIPDREKRVAMHRLQEDERYKKGGRNEKEKE